MGTVAGREFYIEMVQPKQLHARIQWMPGVVLDFALRTLLEGRQVVVAPVPPGDQAALVAAKARRMGGKYRVLENPRFADAGSPDTPEALAEAAEEAEARAAAREESGGLPSPPAAALLNGWREEDLLGSGEDGDAGFRGGYSKLTGLTLGEMALSMAPADWPELADRLYPWEVDGWQPPPGFKPGRLVPKKVNDQAEERPAGVLATVVAPDAELGPAGASAGREDEGDDDEDGDDDQGDNAGGDGAGSDDPRHGYPEESWEAAVAIVRDAWTDPTEPPPHVNKIAARLRGAGLPKLATRQQGQKQLQALFEAVYPNTAR